MTLLPNTARGEYDNGGDVSGNYHIYFTAYVNHNRERTISVELFFPDASIPPFTLFPPTLIKTRAKDVQLVDEIVEVWKKPLNRNMKNKTIAIKSIVILFFYTLENIFRK